MRRRNAADSKIRLSRNALTRMNANRIDRNESPHVTPEASADNAFIVLENRDADTNRQAERRPARPTPKRSIDAWKEENGAPERIRTSDPQIRSLVLYPAELRALGRPVVAGSNVGRGGDLKGSHSLGKPPLKSFCTSLMSAPGWRPDRGSGFGSAYGRCRHQGRSCRHGAGSAPPRWSDPVPCRPSGRRPGMA